MKFKLDENLVLDDVDPLLRAGHDVDTVESEQLRGSNDHLIYSAAQGESRCVITMDLDFSNPSDFPPWEGAGIIVLRPGRSITIGILHLLARQLATMIPEHSPVGKLWIVEPGRIRVHKSDADTV